MRLAFIQTQIPKRSNVLDSKFDKLVFLKQNGICSRKWQLAHQKLANRVIASKLNSFNCFKCRK